MNTLESRLPNTTLRLANRLAASSSSPALRNSAKPAPNSSTNSSAASRLAMRGRSFGTAQISSRPPPSSSAVSTQRMAAGRSRKRPSKKLSINWAWMSTPGTCSRKAVVRMSARPEPVSPTSTSLFSKRSAATLPASTSAAET